MEHKYEDLLEASRWRVWKERTLHINLHNKTISGMLESNTSITKHQTILISQNYIYEIPL